MRERSLRIVLPTFPQRTKIQLSPHPPYDALRCHSRQSGHRNDFVDLLALFRESFSLRDALDALGLPIPILVIVKRHHSPASSFTLTAIVFTILGLISESF